MPWGAIRCRNAETLHPWATGQSSPSIVSGDQTSLPTMAGSREARDALNSRRARPWMEAVR